MKSMEQKKILKVMIHATDKKTLTETLREYHLDIGCAGLRREEDGTIVVESYLPAEKVDELHKPGIKVQVLEDASQRCRERQKEVTTQNNFLRSTEIPHGFGKKE
jgi:hypothetical protein